MKPSLTVTCQEEDGASYRCTVWNRAMGQRQRLETATRLHVKCKTRQTDLCLSGRNTTRL